MKQLLLIFVVLLTSACQRFSPTEQYRAEKRQRDSLELINQQKSLLYYQEQLEQIMPKIDSILPLFKYEKNAQYQDKGFYIINGQQSSRNPNRCYLQPLVRDDGWVQVKCFYYGNISSMQQVQLIANELDINLTGKTHFFNQNGWHGILTLEDTTAIEAMNFIDAYQKQKITIKYINNNKTIFTFHMLEKDKEYIVRAYHLAVLIKDVRKLEKMIYRTSKQIEKYQSELNS